MITGVDKKFQDYVMSRREHTFNERCEFMKLVSSGTDIGKLACMKECNYLFKHYKLLDRTCARRSIKTHPFTLFYALMYVKSYVTLDIEFKQFLTACTLTIDTTVIPWKCEIVPPKSLKEMNDYCYDNMDSPEDIRIIIYYIDEKDNIEKKFVTKEKMITFIGGSMVSPILYGCEPHAVMQQTKEEERLQKMEMASL